MHFDAAVLAFRVLVRTQIAGPSLEERLEDFGAADRRAPQFDRLAERGARTAETEQQPQPECASRENSASQANSPKRGKAAMAIAGLITRETARESASASESETKARHVVGLPCRGLDRAAVRRGDTLRCPLDAALNGRLEISFGA